MRDDCEAICNSADRDEWLKARAEGIGASEMAGVLGRSPWSSPISVFADKTVGEPAFDSEATYWGRTLEHIILEHFGRETKREVSQSGVMYRSKRWPFIFATQDGIQSSERGQSHVEVKNARFFPTQGVPEHYWIQMQHQMAVSGKTWASFAALVSGCEFVWCDVERDEAFILNTIVPMGAALWERVKAGGPPPAPDASEATRKALARIYPEDDGETVPLPVEFVELDLERQKLAQEARRVKDSMQAIDNQVRAAIGDASAGALINGRTYTYKANKRGVRTLRAPTTEEGQSE